VVGQQDVERCSNVEVEVVEAEAVVGY